MIYKEEITAALDAALLKEGMEGLRMPPPVFEAMQGAFISFDRQHGILKAWFPVLPEQLNPYGTMQGGMVGAAIDNTLGPLSILVAPPNYTRRLQIKYRRGITPEIGRITVVGRFVEQRKRQLFFNASVIDNDGNELASAKAVHWIIDSE